MALTLLTATADGNLSWSGGGVKAALGRGGVRSNKREGDGATPAGLFYLRALWYRPDRISLPPTELPLFPIAQDCGWSDDPDDPDYNRPVRLPHCFRHEHLWREDGVYDLIVPLSYNDDPPVPGLGSAIFLHCAHPDYRATEGCIAVAREDLLAILLHCNRETCVEVLA